MDQAGQVREKIDLVSLISEYTPLKKAGSNFKTTCPFHQEKTPSFVVSPERQIWHCFGCGKGGDAYTFLMEYENIEFPEALRTLAKKTGVVLRESSFQKGVSTQKEKIYKLNSLSQKFYNFLLTEHRIGKEALEYLIKKRGLNKELIKTYSLGFSPNDNSLSKYLISKKGYKKEDLAEAGLSYIRNGQASDFFKGRIMFPLTDHRGNIVGFSGRALSETEQSKYINTKETPVYHKGSLFFGLDSAKDEIKKEGAIVVEGELDVLSAFKEGVKNIVAIKGTALTDSQANLLSRFTKKAILCLDNDPAGLEAAKRSLSSLEKAGMTINIVELSEKDPDEEIKKSPGLFKKAVKNARGIYDFLISKAIFANDIKSAEGIKNITSEILPFLSEIGNEVVKEHYIKELAKKIDSSFESLEKELKKIETSKKASQIAVDPIAKTQKRERREILEEYLLALIIQSENPKEILENGKKFFAWYEFDNLAYSKIFSNLELFFGKKMKFDSALFANFLPKEAIPAFDTCFLLPNAKFNKEELDKELTDVKQQLAEIAIKEKRSELAKKITGESDKKKQKELQKELNELSIASP